MLAITADGQNSPPYTVFKRKTMAKEMFPRGITVCVQESGRMTEDLVDEQISMVSTTWCTVTPAIRAGFRQLPGHTTETVKAQLRREKCDQINVLGGKTDNVAMFRLLK
jgi:hypothetical protein